jgi:hypothetical protein
LGTRHPCPTFTVIQSKIEDYEVFQAPCVHLD